jgi:LmbE family N-acetylglucosaminyl deacetylase
MKPTAPLALALCLTLPVSASSQQAATPGITPFTDPANLRGERVSPLNGHELPIDQGALGLAELLRKLNTRASILNIVAHPDDEDGGMLTLYARGFGARVSDLALTRGEGGQNFVTGDFEDALGLIRTQELLANDRYTGVSQMFGTEVDFGFSKTKEEAFAKWTHDRVLYDAVRAIRLVRPLVITATFIGNVTDGHGQHQVSGEIAQEAFKAAADPNVFPDQIAEGLLPWQALKIYARVPFAEVNSKGVFDYATGQYVPARFTNYVTGKVTTTAPNADVQVPEGTADPLLTTAAANAADIPSTFTAGPNTPLSYAQFSRIGLGLQRSQISKNMRLPTTGAYDSGYTLYGSVLCNAPATAKFLTPSSKSVILTEAGTANKSVIPSEGGTANNSVIPSERRTAKNSAIPNEGRTAKNSVILSEGRSPQSKDPCILPAAALPPAASANLTSALEQAPTARLITAQGNAPGNREEESPRAESPIQNPALTTQPNFFTGIDTSIEGIATLAPGAPAILRGQLHQIAITLDQAARQFDPKYPTASLPLLEKAHDLLYSLEHAVELSANAPLHATALIEITPWADSPRDQLHLVVHELLIKQAQLDQALALAAAIRFDAVADPLTVAGQPITVTTTFATDALGCFAGKPWLRNAADLPFWKRDEFAKNNLPYQATPSRNVSTLDAAYTATITRPYFSRKNIEQPVYDLQDRELRNAPASPPALIAYVNIHCGGSGFDVARIVHSGPQPISIIPPVSIASLPTATVLPNGQPTAQLTATLHTDATTSANINVQSPHNWSIEAKAAGPNSVNFLLHPTAPITGPQTFHVTAQTPDHHTYSEGYRAVGYPGLILTNYYTPATTRVVPVDLKLPAHVRIAYLPGTGDAVPEALTSIGLAPTMITVADLTSTKLAAFDTVILGVRAYTANPDLHGAPSQALIDFARNGGNVLVQYETSGLTSADAPYPLSLGGGEKVVDETAPVRLLAPTNPLLTTPNTVTPSDFNGWVAERGHGFLSTWDDHYTPLTETHDPGGAVTPAQLPQRGGLVTVQVGKGRWTYCAFALYRQLPEAIPGAFRLFVNLLTSAN